MITFETGRIRPPSEAESILLRITRGCHWNKCAFCPVYKHEQYSIRRVDEIKRDIDAMAAVADRMRHRMDGACVAVADRAKVVNTVKPVFYSSRDFWVVSPYLMAAGSPWRRKHGATEYTVLLTFIG